MEEAEPEAGPQGPRDVEEEWDHKVSIVESKEGVAPEPMPRQSVTEEEGSRPIPHRSDRATRPPKTYDEYVM